MAASDSDIEDNTAVRNSSIATAPCGGIEVEGSFNRIRRNEVVANGLVFPTPFIDFGIGVFGSGNLLEENSASGNTPHGLVLFLGATGNDLTRNLVLGNPPVAVTVAFGTPLGDIIDFNPPGANIYLDNACEVSAGSAPACPLNPHHVVGHHNIQ